MTFSVIKRTEIYNSTCLLFIRLCKRIVKIISHQINLILSKKIIPSKEKGL